ncbi:ZN574 protein, partial [Eolophus roseicapillus]|nr:ZN574 protein [Eolophus roseicapilla]
MTKFLYHRRSHGAGGHGADPKGPSDPDGGFREIPSSPASFRCLMCSKSFPKAQQLARHQRFVHRLERRHKC